MDPVHEAIARQLWRQLRRMVGNDAGTRFWRHDHATRLRNVYRYHDLTLGQMLSLSGAIWPDRPKQPWYRSLSLWQFAPLVAAGIVGAGLLYVGLLLLLSGAGY